MPWYAYFLAPAALLFEGITAVRNFLFDIRLLPSEKAPFPTLVVGNLSVGGTGKTPWVEFIVRQLRGEVALATLSRGYGRTSSGFLQANAQSTAAQLGDEPLQLFRQFQGEVPVFVGEDRVSACRQIHRLDPSLQLVVLDDAFQHRTLQPTFKILLTPYTTPFFNDHLLPMGRLRESRSGAKRAEVVIVTKCPRPVTESQKEAYRNRLAAYLSPGADVYFSSTAYGKPYPVAGILTECPSRVIAVSGLADDAPFLDYCAQAFDLVDSLTFPDHHLYGEKDAQRIKKLLSQVAGTAPVLLTTEKDAAKLKLLADTGLLMEIPIFALPIQVVLDSKDQEMLFHRLRKNLIDS